MTMIDVIPLSDLGDALSRGEVVAVPGPHGWVALARAGERERLLALPGVEPGEISLTAGSATALADFLPPLGLRAQRVVQRLLPGPVAIRLGEGPVVRLPDHAAWAALAQRREPLLLAPLGASAPVGLARIDLPVCAPVVESRLAIAAGRPLQILASGARSIDQLETASTVHLLFVCSGNTCRSPMLTALTRAALDRRGLGDVRVESAGTFASEGARASDEAQAAMAARGLSLVDHRARPADEIELGLYDRIHCMTAGHAAFMRHLGVADDRLDVINASAGGVPDPYGGDRAAYEACATILSYAADAIAAEI